MTSEAVCGVSYRPPPASARAPVNNPPVATGSIRIAHWQSDVAERCVRAVVKKQFEACRFEHYPDLDEDDVTQELLRWAFAEFSKFDPRKATFVTWVTMFAMARVHNIGRDRDRVAQREAKYVQGRDEEYEFSANKSDRGTYRRVPVVMPAEILDPAPPAPETINGEVVGDSTHPGKPLLIDFAGAAYRQARRMTRDVSRQGHTYEPAQAMAVRAVARYLKLGRRATRGLFEDRADLRRALGFDFLPSHRWFGRAINDPL